MGAVEGQRPNPYQARATLEVRGIQSPTHPRVLFVDGNGLSTLDPAPVQCCTHDLPSLESHSTSAAPLFSTMNIHEYQARELFGKFGVATQPGRVAGTPEEAEKIAAEIG